MLPHSYDPVTEDHSLVGEDAKEVSSIIFSFIGHQHGKTPGQTSIICSCDNKSSGFKVLSGVLVGDERGFHLRAGGWRDGGVESMKDVNRRIGKNL